MKALRSILYFTPLMPAVAAYDAITGKNVGGDTSFADARGLANERSEDGAGAPEQRARKKLEGDIADASERKANETRAQLAKEEAADVKRKVAGGRTPGVGGVATQLGGSGSVVRKTLLG